LDSDLLYIINNSTKRQPQAKKLKKQAERFERNDLK